MCGACGTKVDWAGPLVSGPIRRRDIGRCMTVLCQAVSVTNIAQGWVIKGLTGKMNTAQTLDELCKELLPYFHLASWEDLEAALTKVSPPLRVDAENDFLYASQVPIEAIPVLAAITHLPFHMKLAAFALGVHSFTSPSIVVMDSSQSRCIAAQDGHFLWAKARTQNSPT